MTELSELQALKLINKAIYRFDFEKVQKVMASLDWQWSMVEDDLDDPTTGPTMKVPSIRELMRRAMELFVLAIPAKEATQTRMQGGGIDVSFSLTEDGWEANLGFVVESSTASGGE